MGALLPELGHQIHKAEVVSRVRSSSLRRKNGLVKCNSVRVIVIDLLRGEIPVKYTILIKTLVVSVFATAVSNGERIGIGETTDESPIVRAIPCFRGFCFAYGCLSSPSKRFLLRSTQSATDNYR